MKKIGKYIFMTLAILSLGAASVSVSAMTSKTPAESLAEITNKTVEEVTQAKTDSGLSYGKLAANENKLEAFKLERSQARKEMLEEAVSEGRLTQDQADDRLAKMETRHENCDGTGFGHETKQAKRNMHQGKHHGTMSGNRQKMNAGSVTE